MKSTVEALEGNKVKVVVELEEAEFEKDLDAAFKRLAREVRLPGFRPGKAPRKVLEARIGQSYARDEAFREALPGYYTEAVKEHDVDVIAPPEIDITNGQDEGPVSFDAVVEIRPSITVEGYEALEIEIPSTDVTDEDVDEAVDRMRSGFGSLETVDRPAADDDSVVIDIETFHEGEPVPGLTTDDYVYKVGSGAVVPEIDEQLTGASAGDELEFSADHPDDEEEEPLEFTITVKEVQETVLPEATDEWVVENSEFDTLADLRADFEDNIRTTRINQAQAARRSKLADALAELVDDELVPDAMIDLEVENRAQDMAIRLHAQGMELQTFLQMTGQSQEDFLSELRGAATSSAKLDLALRAVAANESLEVGDDEIDEQLAEVADQLERPADDVRDEFVEAGRLSALRSDLLKSKALDWVSERANLVDEDGLQVSPDALELPTQDDTAADTAAGGPTEGDPSSPDDETADEPSSPDTGEDET
ncbi:MAG: trigger factor [Acidimicrobiia bacterium]|nr:trigger factor [Acidimicrobiia bacterium]